ncbi:PspC domain-containing protein [Nocardioides jishulii]|uniref:PspC domain-containing protein n=1 Tax=Nocardioides jishulii TaxID=2575440 RepID=A0A4U2YUB2_9ACTN|nr:PspC domain-containing protein [Nocardioides jishulii]QCX28337.1 PspC domain-containing protein [Nocardioides jishulii]TKI64770.1 PspC domain-containing protein [Nocardioides jishulii]
MDQTTDPTPGQPGAAGADAAPGGPMPQDGPHVDWEHVKDVNRMHRPADRMVAGVASGLARHFNLDPLVLRVAFGVLALFGGAGILLYAALWLLLPEDGRTDATIPLDERNRSVALAVVAALACLALVGDSWGLYWFPWPLAVVAVVGWFLYSRRAPHQRAATPPPGTPGGMAYAAGAPADPTPAPAQAAPARAPVAASPGAPGAPPTGPGPTTYAWTPTPPPAPRPPLARPRDPRRRGPVLFWFTLALVALAMGVLGTVDLAGVAVPASAYPALAMTICAAMLVLGAFWGRAGGIIALGLVAAVATAGALTAERWDDQAGREVNAPTAASEVRDHYDFRRGELRLDLTDVTDLEALDGRDVLVEAGAGRIVLVLPEELRVDLRAEVGGPGAIMLPDGQERGGIAVSTQTSVGPDEGPRMEITAELGVGEIEVVQR